MASTCPKCHRVLEEDYVCCADVTYTWQCRQCRKRSQGFVVPFGRCEGCGGALEVVADYAFAEPARLRPIQQALQAELNAWTFYTGAAAAAPDPDVQLLFRSLAAMEQDHLQNLAAKYHVSLAVSPDLAAQPAIRALILAGLDAVPAPDRLLHLYGRAIAMERRARAFFLTQVAALAAGLERELYRELAAEEDEHIALLESGLAKTRESLGRQ
jgi:glutamate synthase (NADPH/NADH) small chain